MTKSKKQKQKKAEDFKKVKFKVGKKLPQAPNATSTAFKSKGIILKQQLKDTGFDNHKVANIAKKPKELLAHLQHFNSAFRLCALQSVKAILVANPKTLSLHFGPLLERVAALVSDIEKEVRAAALDSLKCLIQSIGDGGITAYGSTIVAYLRCAMTNLEEAVQIDSIRFLELVFASCHQVLLNDLHVILLNFLDLVSTSPTPGIRSLKISPSNKLTSLRWRAEVLKNVNSMFDLYHSSQSSPTKSDQSAVEYRDDDQNVCVTYHPPFYALQDNISSTFQIRSELNRTVTLTNPMLDVLKELIPLLKESWLECAKGSSELNRDTAKNLLTIISIVRVGCRILESDPSEHPNLEESMEELVNHFFLSGFPFTARRSNVNNQICPVSELNLRFCILCNEFELQGLAVERTNQYINELVEQGTLESPLQLDVILKYLTDKNRDGQALDFLRQLLNTKLANSHILSMKSSISNRLASFTLKNPKLRREYMEILIILLESKAGPHLSEPLIEDIVSYLNKSAYSLSSQQYLTFLALCGDNHSLLHRFLMVLPYVNDLLTSRVLLAELRAVCWKSTKSEINLILHTLLSRMTQEATGPVLSFLCSSLLGVGAEGIVCSDWSALQTVATCAAQLSRTVMTSLDLFSCLESFIRGLDKDIGVAATLSVMSLVQSFSQQSPLNTEDGFSEIFLEQLIVKALIRVLACDSHVDYRGKVVDLLKLRMPTTMKLLTTMIKECEKDSEFKDLVTILYHLRSNHVGNINWPAVRHSLTDHKMLQRDVPLHRNMCKLLSIPLK